MRKLSLTTVLLLTVIGCGREMAPRPPEDFAPVAVSSLQATGNGKEVQLTWRAPSKNQSGEELTNIAGYKIMRGVLGGDADSMKQIGEIKDGHLILLESERAKARAAGISGRRIKLPDSAVSFNFTDSRPDGDVEYQIVPFQSNGQTGKVSQHIAVNESGIKVEAIGKGDTSTN